MTALKLLNGQFVSSSPTLAVEEPLLIRINGCDFATLMTSPGMEKELALGFCFSEGIINSLKEVALLHHCGSGEEATGRVVDIQLVNKQTTLPQRNLEVRSGCGICGRVMLDELCKQLTKIDSNLTVSADLLFQMSDQMSANQKLFKNTGSTHAAALFNNKAQLLAHGEDLGRHNALDKVIGQGLLKRLDFSQTVLILSGRTSYEMILKALRAQIPILASISGATNLAVQMAESMNCTMIGFLRKPSLEIYTRPERISNQTNND